MHSSPCSLFGSAQKIPRNTLLYNSFCHSPSSSIIYVSITISIWDDSRWRRKTCKFHRTSSFVEASVTRYCNNFFVKKNKKALQRAPRFFYISVLKRLKPKKNEDFWSSEPAWEWKICKRHSKILKIVQEILKIWKAHLSFKNGSEKISLLLQEFIELPHHYYIMQCDIELYWNYVFIFTQKVINKLLDSKLLSIFLCWSFVSFFVFMHVWQWKNFLLNTKICFYSKVLFSEALLFWCVD